MATVIRVDEGTRDTLRELSREFDETMSALVSQAVRDLRRKKFIEAANAEYSALRADEEAWVAERQERDAWDATLDDGLDR